MVRLSALFPKQAFTESTDTLFLLSITLLVFIHSVSIFVNPMAVFKKIHAAATRISFGQDPKLASSQDFYSLTDKLSDGTPVSMEQFKGDVLCVVNVASK